MPYPPNILSWIIEQGGTVKEITIRLFETPYGELLIGSSEERICLCDWSRRSQRRRIDNRIQKGLKAAYREGNTPVLNKLERQLNEYFRNKRTEFNLPLLLIGTDFQKSVWKALAEIKYGQTRTYSDLAEMTGRPDAVRAIASAIGSNAISIIIPCHRIIGKNSSSGGYAGGMNTKKKLLELENSVSPQMKKSSFPAVS
jgi:methylated-DNA-[protein]-cysteine S-methyltransferase